MPDEETVYESFNEQAVACVLLQGAVFQADSHKVLHQLIKSFLQSETAEHWNMYWIISQVRHDSSIYSRMELDLHADTVVLGRNCVVLSYTGRECDVSPYSDAYQASKGVPMSAVLSLGQASRPARRIFSYFMRRYGWEEFWTTLSSTLTKCGNLASSFRTTHSMPLDAYRNRRRLARHAARVVRNYDLR